MYIILAIFGRVLMLKPTESESQITILDLAQSGVCSATTDALN